MQKLHEVAEARIWLEDWATHFQDDQRIYLPGTVPLKKAAKHTIEVLQYVRELEVENAKQKKELNEWLWAARRLYKSGNEKDERDGEAALCDLMLGNGWVHIEEPAGFLMQREIDHLTKRVEELEEQNDILRRGGV